MYQLPLSFFVNFLIKKILLTIILNQNIRGGGQAGLASGYHLERKDVSLFILEADGEAAKHASVLRCLILFSTAECLYRGFVGVKNILARKSPSLLIF
ncbi:hypothetical protein B2I21_28130 [Chryseobacterium mucoviscidosis]|nr:hypothetical protein B2I21_28130 [Chryseobacterium mucoviscidosis]